MAREIEAQPPPPTYEQACAVIEAQRKPKRSCNIFGGAVNVLKRFVDRWKPQKKERVFVPPIPSTYDRLKPAEINAPDLVLCATCERFHQRPQAAWDWNIGGALCISNWEMIPVGGERNLDWWQAHLYMRARRLSPAHGPEELYAWEDAWQHQGWMWSLRPKAVDGRLLLKVTATRPLRLDMIEYGLATAPSCAHVQGGKNIQKAIKETILDFTAGAQLEHSSEVYKCKMCPTERKISVRNTAILGEQRMSITSSSTYVTTVNMYVDLGRCESIKEQEWVAMKTASWKGKGARPFVLNEQLESIAERFERRIAMPPSGRTI